MSIEGQHQWQDVQTFTRSSTANVPPHDIASVFVVPVVGKVPGTLVVSNSTATYTITNFGEQRGGMSTSTLAGVDPAAGHSHAGVQRAHQGAPDDCR